MTGMRFYNASLWVLLLAIPMAGCVKTPPRLYQWGSYEEQIYVMYNNPGKVPVEEQLQNLERDFERVRATNAVPPPGLHAHLGYLYYQTGKIEQALQSFENEKRLFPESTVYMDRLIARLKQ